MPMKKQRVAVVFAALAIITTLVAAWQTPLQKMAAEKAVAAPATYPVDHFIDGDTLAVNMDGNIESVRFIGVDTPETVKPNVASQCFGREASDYVKRVIGTQPVRLVADPVGDNRDRYNRLVRYVYLPDGTLLDQLLVERGYGFAYLLSPFSKKDDFSAAEEHARAAKRGLWAHCQPTFDGGRWQSNDI